ncbi:MAG TPA: hypothetical protein VIM31_01615 [Candidatus Microsaccharimonas sp.]|jgi:hypothetical protein
MTYVPPNPNGSALSANSTPVVIASNQSPIAAKIGGTSGGAAGLFATATAYGALRVSEEGTTVFSDQFDSLDTAIKWTASGTSPTVTSGTLSMQSGTAANAFSAITSKSLIPPPALEFRGYGVAVKLEAALTTGSHRFWGVGTAPGSPTAALPLTDAIGFEIDSATGNLFGVVYSSGTRTSTSALTRPIDGGFHKYIFVYRTDTVIFYIDSTEVPVSSLSYIVPNVQTLPVRIATINGTSTLGATPVFQTLAIGINDTGRNALQLADGVDQTKRVSIVTKNTQGITAIATQDNKDSGRNTRIFMLDTITVAPVAEALISVVQWYSNAAVGATTTPAVIPAGKTLRLTGYKIQYQSLATVGYAVVRIRFNTGGVGAIGSPLVASFEAGTGSGATTVAMTGGVTTETGSFPEGLELPASGGIAFSMAGYGPTGVLTLGGGVRLEVHGYEY